MVIIKVSPSSFSDPFRVPPLITIAYNLERIVVVCSKSASSSVDSCTRGPHHAGIDDLTFADRSRRIELASVLQGVHALLITRLPLNLRTRSLLHHLLTFLNDSASLFAM